MWDGRLVVKTIEPDALRPLDTGAGEAQPEIAIAGLTNTRKHTRQLTGLPGKPKTRGPGRPFLSAPTPNQTGLPGLMRTLWKTVRTPKRSRRFRDKVEMAGRNSARDQQDVVRERPAQGYETGIPVHGATGNRSAVAPASMALA